MHVRLIEFTKFSLSCPKIHPNHYLLYLISSQFLQRVIVEFEASQSGYKSEDTLLLEPSASSAIPFHLLLLLLFSSLLGHKVEKPSRETLASGI